MSRWHPEIVVPIKNEGKIFHKKWREDWLGEIMKTREVDRVLKRQVESHKVFTCEKHFHPENMETCK